MFGDFMNYENLVNYYNKFNEDKRLERRHGIVEFTTTMKYIEKYLKNMDNPKIIDIGAGCGKYSLYLYDKGYDVTAVELVKHNLKVIEKKNSNIKTYLLNATNLNKIEDNSYDLVIMFGPLYHLISKEEKIKALEEAKRILKKDGIIMIQYCMKDYAIIKHGFMEDTILKEIENKRISPSFKMTPKEDDLYSFLGIDEINELNDICNLKRLEIFSPDGPTDYIRGYINKMSDEVFLKYLDYVYSISNRSDLIGASSHLVDIIKKV